MENDYFATGSVPWCNSEYESQRVMPGLQGRRAGKKGPEWQLLEKSSTQGMGVKPLLSPSFLITPPWFYILLVIWIYAKSMQKTVWLEQQWFLPFCQKGKWALEPHGSVESGLQQCHLITMAHTDNSNLNNTRFPWWFAKADSLHQLPQHKSGWHWGQRGDTLWSGRDGNCFSQNRHKWENHALVTCSIKLESAGWFIATVLLSHCSGGHLCPQSKNTQSCDSASELHLYIQMGGAVRNSYLGGRKEQESLKQLSQKWNRSFPYDYLINFRRLLLFFPPLFLVAIQAVFQPLWSLLPCFLVITIGNLDFTHEQKMSL